MLSKLFRDVLPHSKPPQSLEANITGISLTSWFCEFRDQAGHRRGGWSLLHHSWAAQLVWPSWLRMAGWFEEFHLSILAVSWVHCFFSISHLLEYVR